MRGIGDERALRLRRRMQPLQQIVQRFDERADFDRHVAVEPQRFERIDRTRRERARQPADRREPARDHQQHQRDRHRQQHAERPQRVQRETQREVLAHRHGLRDLHVAVWLRDAEDAPVVLAARHRVEARRQTLEHRRLRGVIDERAALVPYLDDDAVVGEITEVRGTTLAQPSAAQRRRQRQRDGAQFVVEQLARLAPRGMEDRESRDHRGRRHAEDQPAEQPAANRRHPHLFRR
ncbi:hypothetical protein OKW48_004454 [Paraburkholderia youngii]